MIIVLFSIYFSGNGSIAHLHILLYPFVDHTLVKTGMKGPPGGGILSTKEAAMWPSLEE